ncbi:MAG: hypothetical protein JNL01_01615 [Bdellovibrionales bacterium]|nr:hypothetical protein [Bdellovibrionales bacterium]
MIPIWAALLLLTSPSTAVGRQDPVIWGKQAQEGAWVSDPNRIHLPVLNQSGTLIIDHVDEFGYEVFGPAGTLAYLNQLKVSWSATPSSYLSAPDYPTHTEIATKLRKLARTYSGIAELISIGKSTQGREIWVLKISDNVTTDEVEPEFKYIASMHGDEISGRDLVVQLAEDLLENYGKDPRITQLIDSTEIYLMPSMNPDGNVARTRANSQGFDLNRSFPDFSTANSMDVPTNRPTEVQVVMNWQKARHFSLSANYHGGTFVVNYPWDTLVTPHPLDAFFQGLAKEYAAQIPDFLANRIFRDGVTQGSHWYEVDGGMQDYSLNYHGDLQMTIEVTQNKWPKFSTLKKTYQENREPMIRFIERIQEGFGIWDASKSGLDEVVVTGTSLSVGRFPVRGGEFYKVLPVGIYKIDFFRQGSLFRSEQVEVKAGQPGTWIQI